MASQGTRWFRTDVTLCPASGNCLCLLCSTPELLAWGLVLLNLTQESGKKPTRTWNLKYFLVDSNLTCYPMSIGIWSSKYTTDYRDHVVVRWGVGMVSAPVRTTSHSQSYSSWWLTNCNYRGAGRICVAVCANTILNVAEVGYRLCFPSPLVFTDGRSHGYCCNPRKMPGWPWLM